MDKKIVSEMSLQGYFFYKLDEINKKVSNPLPDEAIYYSSKVLDNFSDPGKCFEKQEGRVKNKILGLKLLECEKYTKRKRKKTLLDIGDSALVICGFFHKSLDRKLFDLVHYHNIGKQAYNKLNMVVPELLGISSFFEIMSNSFDQLANMISVISMRSEEQSSNANNNHVLFFSNDEKKLKVS